MTVTFPARPLSLNDSMPALTLHASSCEMQKLAMAAGSSGMSPQYQVSSCFCNVLLSSLVLFSDCHWSYGRQSCPEEQDASQFI